MKKHGVVGTATALIGMLVSGAMPAAAQPAATDVSAETTAIVGQYCVSCHNERLKTAGLVLDAEGIANIGEHAEVWEKVLRKVRSGAMPPLRARRPEPEVLSRWLTGLEGELDRAAHARPNPGRVASIHRLNRTEYRNVIRDLLDLGG